MQDTIYHSKRKSIIGLGFCFIPLIIWWPLMSIFQTPGRSHPAVLGSSHGILEYYWWKYLAQKNKKLISMIAGMELDIVTRHYTSLRCLCGCWCGGLIVWAWTVHAWLPRGQWGKTLTGVIVMLRHSFLETEKSSPVSPPGCSSWQGSRNNDLWTPSGGRVSVTQLPEVSVNVSGRKKRACCSWNPPHHQKKKKKIEKKGSREMCLHGLCFHSFLWFAERKSA